MENLFNRKQLEKMAQEAEWDLIQLFHSQGRGQRPSMRTWQKGTSKMNKTDLVDYIRGLQDMRMKEQGIT
jgi:hypothetical protein